MPDRTLADLFRTKDVTDDEVTEAVAAYLKAPSDGPRKIGSASLDITAAIQGHAYAREVMADAEAPEGKRRNAVRTAMLLATMKEK